MRLQLEGARDVAGLPEQPDHLAEGPDRGAVVAGEHHAGEVVEGLLVHGAVLVRDRGQRRVGVGGQQPAGGAGRVGVDPHGREALVEASPVAGRRDRDHPVAAAQPVRHEARQDLHELVVVLVEADRVGMRGVRHVGMRHALHPTVACRIRNGMATIVRIAS